MSDEEAVGGVSRNRGSLVSFAGRLAVAWIAPYRLMRFAETRRDGSVMTGTSTWNLPDYGIKQRQQPSRKEQVCGVTLAAGVYMTVFRPWSHFPFSLTPPTNNASPPATVSHTYCRPFQPHCRLLT
ncbi:hypothetical protein HBI32_051150 [Parastagonospora nodorum]|nr:hypothetical protein HBI32_051150 [Parastagonospora nodorum]